MDDPTEALWRRERGYGYTEVPLDPPAWVDPANITVELVERLNEVASQWRCPSCGSGRWVAVADSPGGPRSRQCVLCGHWDTSSTLAPPEAPAP